MSSGNVLRRALYVFRQHWGCELSYVQIVSSRTDDSTGKREIVRKVLTLPAVKLPQSTMRKFIQDIGYLAANKNFTYGALNDYNKMSFMIDRNDLPDDFDVNLNGYVNINGKRYERVSFDDMYDVALVLIVQGVEGANPYAVIDVSASNRLQIQGRATVELN